jgi:hypothetical protein
MLNIPDPLAAMNKKAKQLIIASSPPFITGRTACRP